MAFSRKALYLQGGYSLTPFACNSYTDFTVSMWVNMRNLPTTNNGRSLFGYNGNYVDTFLGVYPTNITTQWPVSSGAWNYTGGVPPIAGSWMWVLSKFKANDYELWQDGIKTGIVTTNGQRLMSGYQMALGAYVANTYWQPSYFHAAEVTFWSRGLTDDECLSLYHGAFKSTANLEAYWPLNGNYNDLSGKGRTLGTVTAGSWVDTSLPDVDKYLLNDGGQIKTWNGTTFDSVGTYPVDVESALFQSKGFYPLTAVPQSAIDQLVDLSPKVLLLSSQPSFTPKGIRAAAVSKPRVVLANSDISLAGVQNLNQINITSTTTGGNVYVVVSVDKGVTWKTWDSTSSVWTAIDTSDANNVLSNGMTPTTLQARTKQDWNNLIGDITKTIRFGYALNNNATANIVNTDSMTISIDMRGRWRTEQVKTDYNHYFINNETIQVELMSSGDYKINY